MCSLLIVFVSLNRGMGGKCIYKLFMVYLFDQRMSQKMFLSCQYKSFPNNAQFY